MSTTTTTVSQKTSNSYINSMTLNQQMEQLVNQLRANYNADITKSYEWRLAQLQGLQTMLVKHRNELFEALAKDMSKPKLEADMCELIPIEDELIGLTGNLKKWMPPGYLDTPNFSFPAYSEVRHDPYGVVLVIAPFNFPVALAVSPLMAALAAGNCVVLKPSELAPNTSNVLAKLLPQYLDPRAFQIVLGGIPETTALLAQKWDMIFFTGSTQVGKIVHQAAAQHLTPTILELGGKSPVIVDKSVRSLELAAKRVVWGKFANAGQACIAPDYVLVHKDIKKEFVEACVRNLTYRYGDQPKKSPDYARIITTRHLQRLKAILDEKPGKVVAGGEVDLDTCYMAPTIVEDPKLDSKLMQEEVFGPILSILEVEDVEDAIRFCRKAPTPLALYVFAGDKEVCDHILDKVPSGGACLNDTLMHFATSTLPFGGVGPSGMGKYHGKFSYEAFTHARGVCRRSDLPATDIPIRYAPYTETNHKLYKWASDYVAWIQLPSHDMISPVGHAFTLGFAAFGAYSFVTQYAMPFVSSSWT